LLEIDGKQVNEVVAAKKMKSKFIELPKHKFESLELIQKTAWAVRERLGASC